MSEQITLSLDVKRQKQLTEKLKEYWSRLSSFPYEHIDKKKRLIYKIDILGSLIASGNVEYDKARMRLLMTYGESFNEGIYKEVFSIIQDYSDSGGQNVQGGTGLPEVKE